MSKKGFGKFALGAAIGAGLGVLFAPKAGKDTRKELKAKIDEMLAKVKDLDMEDVKEEFEIKLYQIKRGMEDLDKEKVLSIAKEKASDIQSQAKDLVDYAVEKGTPVLEKTANSVREKAIVATKEVLAKLEGTEKKETKKKEKK